MNVERRFFFHFDQRLSLLYKFYNISSYIWQNKFINHSYTRISCCHVMLYLLLFSGFFWHIDSLHYDANFTLNGDRNNCKYNSFNIIWYIYNILFYITILDFNLFWCIVISNNSTDCWEDARVPSLSRPDGKFGDYNCDSSYELISSVLQFMKAKMGDNIDFILWTG